MLKMLYHHNQIAIAQSHCLADDDGFGFNMGLHVHDNPVSVLANRAKVLTLFNQACQTDNNCLVDELVWLNQVHSDVVCHYHSPSLHLPNADAWVTAQSGVGLAIMTADCVPIAIFDEVEGQTQMIGCVHAGWQGLVAGIIKKTVQAMPNHLPKKAYIGACIGKDSYEVPLTMAHDIVGRCVADGLVGQDWQTLADEIVSDKGDGKAWLDIGRLAYLQLTHLGVAVINEEYACTYTGAYYSHRRAVHQARPSTGRMVMLIAKLKQANG